MKRAKAALVGTHIAGADALGAVMGTEPSGRDAGRARPGALADRQIASARTPAGGGTGQQDRRVAPIARPGRCRTIDVADMTSDDEAGDTAPMTGQAMPAAPSAVRPALPEAVQAASDAGDPPLGAVPISLASEAGRFIPELYLALNPDVRALIAAGEVADAEGHWRATGLAEEDAGRRPSAVHDHGLYAGTQEQRPHFFAEDEVDPDTYLFLHPDVRGAIGPDPEAARRHWIDFGRAEGRVPGGVAPFRDRRCNAGRLLAKPFGMNVYGSFAALSGLGTAARGMVRALHAAGIPIALWNLDTSHGLARITAADQARGPVYRINLIIVNADQLGRTLSLFPDGQFDDAYNIGVWQWELPAFRPDWFPYFGALDEVWTNSEFQVTAMRSVAPVPVHKVHLPVVVPAVPVPATRADFGLPEDAFVFLLPFDVSSSAARKNPFAAIEAFRVAFPSDTGVFLVLKYHSSRGDPAFVSQLNRAIRGMSNVRVIADKLSAAEMAGLQSVCDALISPHRSEGFGLNIAECMALGKPVVATNYSGNVDFFDAEVGYPVDWALAEVGRWTGPYSPNYNWAEPRKASLVEQLRAVVADPAEAARRGAAAARRIARDFSDEAIGRVISERLTSVNLDASPVGFLGWVGASRGATLAPLSERALSLPYQGVGRLPLLSVVVPVWDVPGPLLEACIQSVIKQTYGFWELCLCNDGSTRPDTLAVLDRYRGTSPRIKIRDLPRNSGIVGASNAAVEIAAGEYVVLLDNDDELHPDALMEVARALSAEPDIDCLYTDEDKIDLAGNRIDHFYKPDWSPEHLESVMYVLHMLVVRKRLILEIGGFRDGFDGAQDYDLMLRISRATDRIHHIPRALYHWRAIPGSAAEVVDAKPAALLAGQRALAEHARAKYGEATRVEKGLTEGTFRVRRQLMGRPRVSLLILTNNQRGEVPGKGESPFVDNFVRSIREKTSYPNYEIIVVDNGRLEPGQVAEYRDLGVTIEDYTGGVTPFNFAAKANFAVRRARSEHIVLLNDDMEVISDDWLTALLEFAQDPEIGVVGGRLLHADGSIQHVGAVIGVNGGAAHPYHCFPRDFVGYNAFTHVIRNYAAVTGACMATRRSVLAQVGGFDEAYAIDYNDIDLCLRVLEVGYRIVYTPFAELYHFEGMSAQRTTQDPAEVAAFRARWSRFLDNDPYYNPNLARDALDFSLRMDRPAA